MEERWIFGDPFGGVGLWYIAKVGLTSVGVWVQMLAAEWTMQVRLCMTVGWKYVVRPSINSIQIRVNISPLQHYEHQNRKRRGENVTLPWKGNIQCFHQWSLQGHIPGGKWPEALRVWRSMSTLHLFHCLYSDLKMSSFTIKLALKSLWMFFSRQIHTFTRSFTVQMFIL